MRQGGAVCAILGALLLLSGTGRAEPLRPAVLSGESRSAATRLAEAGKHAADGRWSEAITQVQAVLDTAGDELVPVTAGRSLGVRRLCHVQLAALPETG